MVMTLLPGSYESDMQLSFFRKYPPGRSPTQIHSVLELNHLLIMTPEDNTSHFE